MTCNNSVYDELARLEAERDKALLERDQARDTICLLEDTIKNLQEQIDEAYAGGYRW